MKVIVVIIARPTFLRVEVSLPLIVHFYSFFISSLKFFHNQNRKHGILASLQPLRGRIRRPHALAVQLKHAVAFAEVFLF